MRRILHVVSTMDYGGAETLLMSIYKKIDRTQIQFDFLCLNRTEALFSEEILKLGGRLFKVDGPTHVGLRCYCSQLFRFFKEHQEYDIIHAHLNWDSCFTLWMAKKAGKKHRISHSHVANHKCSIVYYLYMLWAKRINNYCLTERFACSENAGKYLFGSKASFHIMPNSIDTERFRYSESLRLATRQRLQISDEEYVIGHVGRFSPPKNHFFILKVFAKLRQRKPRSRLLFLGSGPLEEAVRQQAVELGINDHIIFAGLHSDTEAYYSAMDLFLFPSLYEGLGIVAIEAQCSGLPVIASTMVPQFAKVTELMDFISLDVPLDTWCDKIIEQLNMPRNTRASYETQVAESPYNLDKTVAFLQDYYLSL